MLKAHDKKYLRSVLLMYQFKTGTSARPLLESIDLIDYILMLRDRHYQTDEIIGAISLLV